MAVDEYLSQQFSEGQKISEDSGFTLDPKEVRKRTATFCEQNRAYPLFRCLQAFTRCSHSDLFLNCQGEALTLSFLWPEVPEPEAFVGLLNDGTTQAFDHVAHRVSQHLFFGLSAALGQPRYHLSWSTPLGGFTIEQQKLALAKEKISETYCDLTFGIDDKWWKRLTSGGKSHSELKAELRKRLCYCPVPVRFNGEELLPEAPQAPERPWSARLAKSPKQLAWRFLQAEGSGRLRPPSVSLEQYRAGQNGTVFHLTGGKQSSNLPLSIQLQDLRDPDTDPLEANNAALDPGHSGPLYERMSGSLNEFPLSETAMFLSIEGGRQDWLLPIRDGFLGDPTPVKVSKGGLVILSAFEGFRYDLSGLKVVEDDIFEAKLEEYRLQAKELKKILKLTLANISLRAETLPLHYYQAASYLVGGPFLAMLGSKMAPTLAKMFSRPEIRPGQETEEREPEPK